MALAGLIPYLAPLGAGLVLLGFLCRNQLWLRFWAILGNLCFIAYYVLISDVPLWTAIVSSSAIIAANLYMMSWILKDRRMFKLTAEEMMLFARLPGLSPGQFKRLLAEARWTEAQTQMPLTEVNVVPDGLHYLLEGQATVKRDGKTFDIGPHAFVGEIAFLKQQPATATVYSKPGSLYVSWPPDKLRALMASDDGINRAMSGLLSGDLAEKVARGSTLSRA